jgi:hypothetical protein
MKISYIKRIKKGGVNLVFAITEMYVEPKKTGKIKKYELKEN